MNQITQLLVSLVLLGAYQLQAALKFNSQSSTLQLRGTAAKLILDTNMSSFDGTLKITDQSSASIESTNTSNRLEFNEGILHTGTSGRAVLNAISVDPASGDKILLTGNALLDTEGGTIIQTIEISGTNNVIRGQPQFAAPITLVDNATALSLSLQTKLNQNIVLNGGTLTLLDDLQIQDGATILGTGIVNINEKTLFLPSTLGGTAWNNAIEFQNANDIRLNGYTVIDTTGTFNFTGSGQTSNVNGNGNILDISAGGIIQVGANHTLYLTDLHLKGLGTGSGDLDMQATSNVKLSNCTIELDGNYLHNAGIITIQGNNCVLISRNGDIFNIDGSGTILRVDGVLFAYDPLGSSPSFPSPFTTSNGGAIQLLNDGVIRAGHVPPSGSGGSPSINYSVPSGSGSNLLPNSHQLGPESIITLVNNTPGTPKTMVLDGQGFWIKFNYTTGQYLKLEPNITLTLQNVFLDGFDPDLIEFDGVSAAKSKIIFGDNCVISMNKDLTVSSSAWNCSGDATILGNNNTLSLNNADTLTITNTKTLTIKDTLLRTNHYHALHALNNNATIKLQNMDLSLSDTGLTFDMGNVRIADKVNITGANATTVDTPVEFNFTSAGTWQVASQSSLKIDRNLKLFYNPDISGDAGDPDLEKKHFKLLNPSAKLCLDGCTLKSGSMGLAFDYGQVYIDGRVVFDINPATGAEVEFGTALQVEIAPAALLDINGALKYTTSTYP